MKKWPYKRDGFSYKATPSVMKKWPYKRDGFSLGGAIYYQ
jgi:hypothetical protein